MSAVVKNRGRNNLPVSTTALWLVLGLAVIFFLVNYGQELLLASQLDSKSQEQRAANTRLSDENTRLRAMLQYYQSDKYVEQRAREDLNLRRADEEVIIPVGTTTAPSLPSGGRSAGPSNTEQSPSAAAQEPEPTWLKWLDLFQPPR